MNIFKVITGNIVKWWQLTVMPILRIDNNNSQPYGTNQPSTDVLGMDAQAVNQQGVQQQTISQSSGTQTQPGSVPQTDAKPDSSVETSDAQAVMDRINREREEKRLQDMEKARMKAEEEARLASIMNANKVDVDAFIQAGKKAKEEKKQEESPSANVDADALARAQEIMDRLNREAAEDEAKKLQEIEEAKKKAQETFGL